MIARMGLNGYEVNTDAALVDPDWDVFTDQHDKRYGLAISHLKSVVKGSSYDNEVIRLRVGDRGYYAQSKRFPAAFFGDTTAPAVEFVTEEEARAITWEAVALYRAGEAQSLTAIYRDGEPGDLFFGYRVGKRRRYELGGVRAALPLHLRVLVDSYGPSGLIEGTKGVLIYQRASSGRHLVLRAEGRRQPYVGITEILE